MRVQREAEGESRISAGRVCRECSDGLDAQIDHCHGTVILHIGRRAECTDDCDAPEAVHTFVIDCAATGCGCAGVQPIGSEVESASAVG